MYASKVIIVANFSLLLLSGCSSNPKLKLDNETLDELKLNIIFAAVDKFDNIKIKDNVDKLSWLFKEHDPINNKEMIDFSFQLNDYGTKEYTTINRKIQGQIDYNFKTETFSCDNDKWKVDNGVPTYWNNSLVVGSSIIGNAGEFTIMVTNWYWKQLKYSLSKHKNKYDLFLSCSWKTNTNLFKELKVKDIWLWFDINYDDKTWWLPTGHIAIISLWKVDNEYFTLVNNLTEKYRYSQGLVVAKSGSLSSLSFIVTDEMSWWVNKNLLVNIYDTLRYFRKTKKNLNKNIWLKQVFFNPNSGRLNLQNISNHPGSKQKQIFNAVLNMSEAELSKQINKNYFAYKLAFKKIKGKNWTWISQNTIKLDLNSDYI